MAYGTILEPAIVTGTTAFQPIGTVVPAGKVRSYTLRAANIGSADAYAHVRITKGATVGRRAINFPVKYQSAESAPDLESQGVLILPAGWQFEVMASAASAIEFTLSGVEDDA